MRARVFRGGRSTWTVDAPWPPAGRAPETRYAPELALRGAEFVVDDAGRRRCLRVDGAATIHAWVEGDEVDPADFHLAADGADVVEVVYRPAEHEHFVRAGARGRRVNFADAVLFTPRGDVLAVGAR